MNLNFWKNKRVFITGHTGFKGSWLTLILSSMGAKITGFALNPISLKNTSKKYTFSCKSWKCIP